MLLFLGSTFTLLVGCVGDQKPPLHVDSGTAQDTEISWVDTGWDQGLHVEGPDFQPVAPGCSTVATMTLRNGGPIDLNVAVLADAPFSTETTQLDLAVGEQAVLTITFAPIAEGTKTGSLWLSGDTTLALPLQGVAREPSRTEVTLTPGAGDVVLVVDQSANMKDKAESVLVQLDSLLSLDGRVYILTEDDGTLHPATTVEEARVVLETTTGGMFTEALFVLARNAAAAESLASPVHFVLISDEPEQSPSALGGTEGMTNSVWLQRPDARFHAVAGPVPGGGDCAVAGHGYYEMVGRSEGVYADLCADDLSEPVADIRLATRDPLTWFYAGDTEGNPAVEASLTVDGEPRQLTWQGSFVHFNALPLDSEVVFTTTDTLTCD